MKKKALLFLSSVLFVSLFSCGERKKDDDTIDIPDVPKLETVDVTFRYHDDSINVVTLKKGDKVENPGDDIKCKEERYKFEGWFLNGELYDFDLPVSENIELVSTCVSYDSLKYEVRWEYLDGVQESDISVERDTSLQALGNNQYFQSLKDKEKRLTFSYDDEYIIKNPISSIKGKEINTEYSLYNGDTYIKKVSDGDTINITCDYRIVVGSKSNSIDISYNGENKESLNVYEDYIIKGYGGEINENKKFLGYSLDDTSRIYFEGEILTSEELKNYESIDFNPVFADLETKIYHIKTIEDRQTLLENDFDDFSVDDEDLVISLDSDLDFKDEDFGPGIFEFNGIFLGNNHTISNAKIDENDENDGCGTGLIQYTTKGCSVFDLYMKDIETYTLCSYGQGVVIGEADSHINLHNVHSDGVRVAISNSDTYGYSINGVSGFVGSLCSASIVDCSVNNVSFIGDREFFGEPFKTSTTVDITFGGMIGTTYGTDSDNYCGLSIKQCDIDNIKVDIKEMDSASIGGVCGALDTEYSGHAIINNKVTNIDINISDWNKTINSGYEINCGGFAGIFDEYTLFRDSNYDVIRPNIISKNILENIDIDVVFNKDKTSFTNKTQIYSGLFNGDEYVNIGSNNNLQVKGTSLFERNSLSGSINIDCKDEYMSSYVGGISGECYQVTKGRSIKYIENNEINLDATISGTNLEYSKLGGIYSYFANDDRDGTYIGHNVLKGRLNNVSEEYLHDRETDPSRATAGILGLVLNGEAYVEVSQNLVMFDTDMDEKDYASFCFYSVDNAYDDDEAYAEMHILNNGIYKDSKKGEDLKYIKYFEFDLESFVDTQLSSSFWKIEDGNLNLI